MIAFLRGKLAAALTDTIVLDVNGVGYQIQVPNSTFIEMPSIGEEVTLYTHLVVREDSLQLYGFKTEDELNVFLSLLTVKGVGPKGALAVLSVYQPARIRAIFAQEDIAALTRVPGIGKKSAQRLILELKDKLGVLPEGYKQAAPAAKKLGSKLKDAESALIALGYNQSEAHQAVRAVENMAADSDTAGLIKAALKYLMKG